MSLVTAYDLKNIGINSNLLAISHALYCRTPPTLLPNMGKQPSTGASKTLGPDRVPENQKREVYERVRRALEAKGGVCTQHKV